MAQSASVDAAPLSAPFRKGSGSSGTEPVAHSDGGRPAGALSSTGHPESVPPLSASWRQAPLSQVEKDKVHRILQACRDRDLDELRELGTSDGGLIEDEVRRTACESDDRKDARKHELSDIIVGILRQHPMLHYFQGYHDIVQVLLLVLGANAAAPAVARLSLLRIRDFMLPTMSGTEPHLDLIKAILYTVDPALAKQLSHTAPFFALSATLTLYAHDIETYGDIARLYDFLLASEAAMSLYLFAAIIMSRKDELSEMEADEPEMLLVILSKLPKPLDLESLVRDASEIFARYPPESLSQPPIGSWSLPARAWRRVSANSVLKTTHGDPHKLAKQRLVDGERMFAKHAAEIMRNNVWKRQMLHARKLAKRYRRPVTYTATAVVVAAIALLFRRSSYQPSWTALLQHLLSPSD
ncbi:hypothetical protein LTR08_008890 [Meristemomyces frigidus]|nr:hypothetical protein LTR08_008890 [Meristemomyces frigidus]